MTEPAYDPVELRRRMVVCFSVSELRKLAESLGVVGSIAWERGIHEAARDLVRRAETYAGLPALVAKLREVRPLVEWPDPEPAPDSPASNGASSARSEVVPEAASAVAFVPDRRLNAPAGPSGMVAGEPPPFADPYAALPPSAPASRSPPAAAWPGVVPSGSATPERSGGIDPRVLVAVAGLTLAAAVVAYLAGRASTGSSANAGGPAPSAQRRTSGPATVAADALARSLSNVARVCELSPSASGARVLQLVFERCGRAPREPRSALVLPSIPPRDPVDGPDPVDAPKRKPARDPTSPAARDLAPTVSAGCMAGCDSEHRGCKDRCGAEPTESSQYDSFQKCLSRCLATASHCRLSCH